MSRHPLLPLVEPPARSFQPARRLHENPFEIITHVHAQFDGFTKDYYVVEFGPRAGVVPVRDGCILLTAQYRFLIDRMSWEIPGGRIDPGEDAATAAHRECLEETGFDCRDLEPLVTYRPGLDNVENLTSIFFSERVEQRRPFTPDPAEALAIAWLPVADCVDLVLAQEITDALTVTAVLAYACHRRRR